MRKVKFKNVTELYGGESEVLKPKVTSLMKGSFSSEGLADEVGCAAPSNVGPFNVGKGFVGAQFSSSKLGSKEESETFTTCAPSCSPCVHSEQMASRATMTNECSVKVCQKKDSNCCSVNDADLSSCQVNSACSGGHHTSSETSHPLSACLSRESFSENAESEETLRNCNTSERIKMIINANLHQTCANSCGSLTETIFHDKVVSNQIEKLEESECLGDNISYICGSDHAKTRASDHNSDTYKKNTSYSSASVDSFSETEKAVNDQPSSCCLVDSPCGVVDDNHPRRSNRSSDDFSQEILCCSNKSDLSEISSLRDSCAGGSSAKGGHSLCFEDQVQSSFAAKADALQVGSQIGDEPNSAESIQVDTGIYEREQIAKLKSTTVVKEVNMEETTIGSRVAACSGGLDSPEYEVKVCDICGDIGREELLAVCSECNDGAEHTYCMRVKMDNVPKGDWLCGECLLGKETEKQKQDKLEGVRIFQKSYSLESKSKGLEIKESKAHKISSTSLYSSKRSACSLQAVRTRPFGTVLKSPRTLSSSSKTSMHQSGGQFFRSTAKTVEIPTELSNKSLKLSSQSQVSRGFLFKSNSFSATSLKDDVQWLKEGSFRNEGFAKETAASESKGRVQMMSKSMSLKNMRSYSVNNSYHDSKLLPNFSRGEDLKRSRHSKGQNSTKPEKKLRLAKSDSLTSMADKRIAFPGKNILPQPYSSSSFDLMAVKGHEISDNSWKKSGHSSHGGSPNEEKTVVNMRHHVEYATEAVPATTTKHSKVNVHSDEQPCLRDLSMFDSEVHMPSWTSAFPQLDYIWQGKFEIQRSGGLPFTIDGMQGHLSTYASNKVPEVVQKLPEELLFEEASRLNMWPAQFMKSHATEDNIALYFFAKDLGSYERSYKNLLDRMIKNDFSLKGNFGGVELLIFSSNLLPEKSQRWNNLLFLWGVFRGKRIHCSGQIPTESASENLLPPGKSSQSISASLLSCNNQQTLSSNALLVSKAVTSERMVEACEIEVSSLEPKPPDIETSSGQEVCRVDSSQREENESKRRLNIDLNYSLQENQESPTDHMEADVRHEIDLNLSPQENQECSADQMEADVRHEIDLNYSPQENQDHSADYMEVDGRHECKRFKSCLSGLNIGNNGIKDRNER